MTKRAHPEDRRSRVSPHRTSSQKPPPLSHDELEDEDPESYELLELYELDEDPESYDEELPYEDSESEDEDGPLDVEQSSVRAGGSYTGGVYRTACWTGS